MKKLFYLTVVLFSIICEEKENNSNEENIINITNPIFCGLTQEESEFLNQINSLSDLEKEALFLQCLEDATNMRSMLKIENENLSLKGDFIIRLLNCKRSVNSLINLMNHIDPVHMENAEEILQEELDQLHMQNAEEIMQDELNQ